MGALISDFAFLAVLITSSLIAYKYTASIALTFLYVFLSIAIAGVIGQIAEEFGLGIDTNKLNLLIGIVSLIMVLFVFQRYKLTRSNKRRDKSLPLLCLSGVVVLGGAVVSRIFANGQESGVLTQFAYLNAEDNGAWLNVSTNLVGGKNISFGHVGGPLIVFLSICQSISKIIVFAMTGNLNDLAIVLNTVVVAYLILMILVSIAISPLVNKISDLHSKSAIAIGFCFWFLIYGALLIPQSSGHLSFILVIVVYLISSWQLTSNSYLANDERRYFVAGLIVVMPVWLPLNLLTVFLISWTIINLIRTRHESKIIGAWKSSLVVLGLILVGTGYLLRSSLDYSTSSLQQAKNLIGAGGGTAAASTVLLVLFTISILFLSIFQEEGFAVRLIPIYLGFGYTVFVVFADFWLTGQMNYGSTKLLLGATIIMAPISMSLMLETYIQGKSTFQLRNLVGPALVFVIVIGMLDGATPTIFRTLSPVHWPSSLSNELGTWRESIKITKSPVDIIDLPVGCVTRDGSGDIWVDMESYACSRSLVSIAGIWNQSTPLIEFQLFPDKPRVSQLDIISGDLLERTLLILDSSSHEVVGKMSVREFRDYFKKHPLQ